MTAPRPALAGLRVLDLTQGVAGPTATRFLAGYGADVVKVEPPGGDISRRWGPFPGDRPHPEKSGFFLALNTGKRSVVVDIEDERGRRLLTDLAARAEVIVESFAPGVLDELDLGWERLHAAHPSLVVVSISNFGQDGPAARHPASALTAAAAGGQMWLTGEADGPPRKTYGHQAAYQAGFHAFAAALAAVVGARRHGAGEHIDISMQEVQAATLEMYGPNAWNHDVESYRLGNMLRATWGIYPCADGYVGVHALPRNVPGLLRAIDEDDLARKYEESPASILEDNDLIEALLYSWCGERTKREIFSIALQRRAPIAYVPTVEEVLSWPGLLEKEFFVELDHPAAGPLPYPSPPFTMGACPTTRRRAPLLDEHRDEVLAEWLGHTQRATTARPPKGS